jgi:hypothetical protein
MGALSVARKVARLAVLKADWWDGCLAVKRAGLRVEMRAVGWVEHWVGQMVDCLDDLKVVVKVLMMVVRLVDLSDGQMVEWWVDSTVLKMVAY